MNSKFYDWAQKWSIHPAALAELCNISLPDNVPLGDTPPMPTTEANTQQGIRLEAPRHGNMMWRNNNGACFDDTGRLIRYGLGNESARLSKKWTSGDLVGIQGHTGRFVMCEVKAPGWTAPTNDRERAQETALQQVNALGGIGFFATSVEDYIRNTKL